MFNKIVNRVKADAVKKYAADVVDQLNEEFGKRVSFNKMSDKLNVFDSEKVEKPAKSWTKAMMR